MLKRWTLLFPVTLAVCAAAGVLARADEPVSKDGERPAVEEKGKAEAEKPKDAKDAEAPKVGLAPGNLAPDFTLKDLDGGEHTLSKYRGKIVVLEWTNHGCPLVKKHYDAGNMQKLQKQAAKDGVVWLSICSSAPGKQGHMDAEKWKTVQKEKDAAPAAVLPDTDGKIGKLFKVQRTPTMWVIDAKGVVAFTGAIDDDMSARGEDIAKARNYVTEAVAALKAGKTPEVTAADAYG